MNHTNRFNTLFNNKRTFGNTSNTSSFDLQLFRYFYLKYRFATGPKNLTELKKFALEEAKKISSLIKNSKNSKCTKRRSESEENNKIIDKPLLKKLLLSLFDIINPLLIKLHLNFKNERRKNYQDNGKYLEIIKAYEQQKMNLLTYTIKSICKMVNLQFSTFQKNIFSYIEKNDLEIIRIINSFCNLGKLSALAPKFVDESEIIEILKNYYDNLKYLIENSQENEMMKYSLIFISDIIYENYGMEDEQIFACIEEKKLMENKEVCYYFKEIQVMIQNNLNLLFDL
jgi:hypothetical protein